MWDHRKRERVFYLVDKKEVMGKEVEGCNEGKRKHKKAQQVYSWGFDSFGDGGWLLMLPILFIRSFSSFGAKMKI